MKKLLALVGATVLAVQPVVAAISSNSPGGGGAMTCSAINGQGGVIVGTDNGGVYYRTSPSGTWSKSGSVHGINSNNVMCAAFGKSPNVAVVAGDGFLAYTLAFGASPATSWTNVSSFTSDTSSSTISITSSMNFTAAAFGSGNADSCVVFLGMTDGSIDRCVTNAIA